MNLHPLCTLFPRMSGADFASLVADIKANGLDQPIVTHDGMILDGGNRYAACLEAGVEPRFVAFSGGNLVTFVLSANLHRRHMTAGQQAAIVAAAQDWATAHPAHRVSSAKEGCNVAPLSAEEGCNVAPLSRVQDRAAAAGASVRTQKMADKVARERPELAKAVARGEISLPAAVREVEGRPEKAAKAPSREADDELERLRAEVIDLREKNDVLAKEAESLLAENAAMARVFDADDRLKAAVAEAKKYRELAEQLQTRLNGMMNEKNELLRTNKALRRKYEGGR